MFYTFDQNNSGGTFGKPAMYVIIEAADEEEANWRATKEGIYFDGLDGEDPIDCPCCGERWYRAYDGNDFPAIYGEPVENAVQDNRPITTMRKSWAAQASIPSAIVVYKDGTRKEY